MKLPTALPDESLYSRYIRHMTVLGMNEQNYLKALLKKCRPSIHPYLTIGVISTSKITNESISSIYSEQTLCRLFTYYLPKHANNIYKELLNENSNSIIRACQLPNFKEKETLSLKFCPTCAIEDISKYGVTYWHTTHQVPGLETCALHQSFLLHRDLPKRPHLEPNFLPDHNLKPQECSALAHRFAKFVSFKLKEIACTSANFSHSNLLNKLHTLDYSTASGRFRRKELSCDLFEFATQLDYKSPNLLPNSPLDYKYLSYLLYGHVSQHPFKYLLIEFWLNFSNKKAIRIKPAVNKQDEQLTLKCKTLLEQGISLAKTSRITGKSTCYLKALAIKNNIPIKTNPVKIDEGIVKRVLVMASKGFHRQAIASLYQISTGSVEQIISTKHGLVEQRRKYKWESKRRKYKVQILRAINKNPCAIRQEIKMACYAAFYWLYAHERDWLNNTLPKPIKPKIHSR